MKLTEFLCHRAVLEYDIEQYMHINFLFDFKGFSVIVICKPCIYLDILVNILV